MGEDAGLAHARGRGQRADGKAFEAGLRRQMQGRIQDMGLGLLPLVQPPTNTAGRGLAVQRGERR
ncbi:hypothetical protein D3C79_1073360 [compost metagenome]